MIAVQKVLKCIQISGWGAEVFRWNGCIKLNLDRVVA